MWKTDEELRQELEAAFAPAMTEDEFVAALREGLARGAGGEHEVSVPVERHPVRWTVVGLAAAACVLLALLLVPRSDPHGLPVARNAAAPKGNLPILVAKDGSIVMDWETAKTPGVFALIGKVVGKRRKAGTEKLLASIEANRTTPWRGVHDVLKGLAKVGVPAEIVVVDPESEERRALPVPWPDDPAVTGKPEGDIHEIVLSRGMDETKTWLELNDSPPFDTGDGALDHLQDAIRRHADEARYPVRIEAYAAVPLHQVIRLIDIIRGAKLPLQGISIDAPAFLTVKVVLQQDGKETKLYLPDRGRSYGLEEGLEKLALRIKLSQMRGRKVHGLLDSAVYIDQEAVKRVLAVFEKAGITDVPIIH